MLSHKEVESLLTAFMSKLGWEKRTDKDYKFLGVHPDRMFYSQGKPLMLCEIKPENAGQREILTGIGQCALFHVCDNVEPYLVLHQKWFGELEDVFSQLAWLGIIIYRSIDNPATPRIRAEFGWLLSANRHPDQLSHPEPDLTPKPERIRFNMREAEFESKIIHLAQEYLLPKGKTSPPLVPDDLIRRIVDAPTDAILNEAKSRILLYVALLKHITSNKPGICSTETIKDWCNSSLGATKRTASELPVRLLGKARIEKQLHSKGFIQEGQNWLLDAIQIEARFKPQIEQLVNFDLELYRLYCDLSGITLRKADVKTSVEGVYTLEGVGCDG